MMTERKTVLFYIPPMLLFLLGSFFILYSRPFLLAEEDPEIRAECQRILTALELIQERYVDKVSTRELCLAALEGIESKLDDYSQFYYDLGKKKFDEETEGRFGGIGVLVRHIEDALTVIKVLEGKPAHRAGLRIGDRIVSVNGEKFYPLPKGKDDDMLQKIKGPVGTEVLLGIVGSGGEEERKVKVVREEVKIDSVEGARMVDPKKGIGYIRLSTFSDNTAKDFDEELKKLQKEGLRDLILDIRFNSGGPLKEALEVADRFLSEGVILSSQGRFKGSSRVYRATSGNTLSEDLGLILLINGGSASASEVVAGALQDHKRALLVGTRSYGKGLIQSVLPLNNEGSEILKITTAKYYTPSNRCIHRDMVTRKQPVQVVAPEGAVAPMIRPESDEKEAALQGGLLPDFVIEMTEKNIEKLVYTWADDGIPQEYQNYEKKFSEKPEAFRDSQLDFALSLLRGENPSLPMVQEKVEKKKE